MKLLKIFSISSIVFFSLFWVVPALAETTTTTATTQEAVVLADVSVHNARVVSQKGNVFDISFNIVNNEGAQAGLKYSISLVKETAKGQFLADEYVYPETLSIGANITLKKDITYTAPANLNGDYTLLVMVKNGSGLTLGLGVAGKIKLIGTTNTIEILPDTCTLSVSGEKGSPKYTLTQGVDIASTENLILNCTALNSSKSVISVTPTYETHYRTISGDVVPQIGGDVAPISFNAGEQKSISLLLPKASIPQAYDIKVSLKSGDIYSNSIVAHYVIHGASATINNFSLDKNSYKKDDVAKISLTWSPSADSFHGSRLGSSTLSDITLIANIINDNQKECINPLSQILDKNEIMTDIVAPIIANCNNPVATVILKDANGNTLDQKILSFESKTVSATSGKNNLILIILGILVVAGLAVYFINLKKKQNETINQ